MIRLFLPALFTVAVLLGACSAGSTSPTSEASIAGDAVTISARDMKFSTNTLSAPADEPFQIVFDNQESAPHNVAIYRDGSAAESVFASEPFSGPAIVTYEVPALRAGAYFFRCDLHPAMSGELSVD